MNEDVTAGGWKRRGDARLRFQTGISKGNPRVEITAIEQQLCVNLKGKADSQSGSTHGGAGSHCEQWGSSAEGRK